MLPDAQIYWHLLSRFCACHPCGAMEILRRRLSHFCAYHLCGAMEILQGASNSHGWLRRTYGLKFWRWRGHLVLGTPAIVLGGPHLASPASPRTSQWQKPSCSHLGSITWTVWPSGLRRWLKAPFRKGVGSNPTTVTPTHHTPTHQTDVQVVVPSLNIFSGHATILFLLLLDVFKESPSSRNHERSGAVVRVLGS